MRRRPSQTSLHCLGQSASHTFAPHAGTDIGETADGKGKPKEKKRVLAPNSRGWAVRSAFGGVMNILALYFGTRECYIIMAACAGFRETVDSIQCLLEGGDSLKKAFTGYIIPAGKFPQMIYFPPWAGGAVINYVFLYYIVTA